MTPAQREWEREAARLRMQRKRQKQFAQREAMRVLKFQTKSHCDVSDRNLPKYCSKNSIREVYSPAESNDEDQDSDKSPDVRFSDDSDFEQMLSNYSERLDSSNVGQSELQDIIVSLSNKLADEETLLIVAEKMFHSQQNHQTGIDTFKATKLTSAGEVQEQSQGNTCGNKLKACKLTLGEEGDKHVGNVTNGVIKHSKDQHSVAAGAASGGAGVGGGVTRKTSNTNLNNNKLSVNVASKSYPSFTPVTVLTKSVALQYLEEECQQKCLEVRRKTEEALLNDVLIPMTTSSDFTFVPNANSNEFTSLIGLEEVVNKIQDHENYNRTRNFVSSTKCSYAPFLCSQCGSDYTPQWKRREHVLLKETEKSREKNSKRIDKIRTGMGSLISRTVVLCESCVASCTERRLSEEYTNKIRIVAEEGLEKENSIEREYRRMRYSPEEVRKFIKKKEAELQDKQSPCYHRIQTLANDSQKSKHNNHIYPAKENQRETGNQVLTSRDQPSAVNKVIPPISQLPSKDDVINQVFGVSTNIPTGQSTVDDSPGMLNPNLLIQLASLTSQPQSGTSANCILSDVTALLQHQQQQQTLDNINSLLQSLNSGDFFLQTLLPLIAQTRDQDSTSMTQVLTSLLAILNKLSNSPQLNPNTFVASLISNLFAGNQSSAAAGGGGGGLNDFRAQ